jgi:hypothetical protein
MIVGFSYHSRSFLKTEFDETAEVKHAVAALSQTVRRD